MQQFERREQSRLSLSVLAYRIQSPHDSFTAPRSGVPLMTGQRLIPSNSLPLATFFTKFDESISHERLCCWRAPIEKSPGPLSRTPTEYQENSRFYIHEYDCLTSLQLPKLTLRLTESLQRTCSQSKAGKEGNADPDKQAQQEQPGPAHGGHVLRTGETEPAGM